MLTAIKLVQTTADVSNSPAPHERARTAGGLPAPVEPERRDLLPRRLDGQQVVWGIPHTAHDRRTRSVSRRAAVAEIVAVAVQHQAIAPAWMGAAPTEFGGQVGDGCRKVDVHGEFHL